MARKFRRVDYTESLKQTVRLADCLAPEHLARFIVGIIGLLDVSQIYARYAPLGGEAFAPEVLLGVLFDGYATGVFSSRKLETATYLSIPFRFIAGGWHPDHDTIATFRKTFLAEIGDLFTQVLVVAHELGVFTLGNISVDGSKIHADASKSRAVSYGHLPELEQRLHAEVETLMAWGEHADQSDWPEGLDVTEEIRRRRDQLLNLSMVKAILETRAQERLEAEQAEYEAKMREREAIARETGHRPQSHAPARPCPGPRERDQYNFTDPDSRIMKNSTNAGFDQHYNVQVAVDQASLLIVGSTLSNHPNDKAEALPTIEAIPAELGQPPAAALDNGYYSPKTIDALETRGLEPYIATGREPHHQSWLDRLAQQPMPLPADASPIVKMASKLRTEIGQAIYRLRQCTVEPVIGIVKEVLGFRQFSLRGQVAAAGEWCLVCLAFDLKRLHKLITN